MAGVLGVGYVAWKGLADEDVAGRRERLWVMGAWVAESDMGGLSGQPPDGATSSPCLPADADPHPGNVSVDQRGNLIFYDL